MMVLYIDESGVPELSSLDKYCILTGVLIDEENENNYVFLMNRIKEKYNLSLYKNLHTVDLFEKKNAKEFLGITQKRKKIDHRKSFQKDAWSIIKDYRVQYKAVCVPKEHVQRHLFGKYSDKGESWFKTNKKDYYAKADNQLPMDVGINALYHWALRKIGKGEKLKIVFESRGNDNFTIRNHNLVSDVNLFTDVHMIAFARAMKKQVVSVAFANKEVESACLELCDIIGYTANVYYVRCKKNVPVDSDLKKSVLFTGIHKTLSTVHYQELSLRVVRKYILGLRGRTKRIANHYHKISHSLSPANAGSQI